MTNKDIKLSSYFTNEEYRHIIESIDKACPKYSNIPNKYNIRSMWIPLVSFTQCENNIINACKTLERSSNFSDITNIILLGVSSFEYQNKIYVSKYTSYTVIDNISTSTTSKDTSSKFIISNNLLSNWIQPKQGLTGGQSGNTNVTSTRSEGKELNDIITPLTSDTFTIPQLKFKKQDSVEDLEGTFNQAFVTLSLVFKTGNLNVLPLWITENTDDGWINTWGNAIKNQWNNKDTLLLLCGNYTCWGNLFTGFEEYRGSLNKNEYYQTQWKVNDLRVIDDFEKNMLKKVTGFNYGSYKFLSIWSMINNSGVIITGDYKIISLEPDEDEQGGAEDKGNLIYNYISFGNIYLLGI